MSDPLLLLLLPLLLLVSLSLPLEEDVSESEPEEEEEVSLLRFFLPFLSAALAPAGQAGRGRRRHIGCSAS